MVDKPSERPVPALRLSERRKLLNLPVLTKTGEASSTLWPGRRIRHSLSDSKAFQEETVVTDGEGHRGRVDEFFELDAVLGAGSVTQVRLARRRSDGEEVAVKCSCSHDEEVQHFTREEYRLLRELEHPSVLRVIALHEKLPDLWMVMELCRDGCLETYVESHGVFGEEPAKALFQQLLEGVNYLHGRRIVHRDLKPANVLLTDAAKSLRIADFNSAKRIGAGSGSSLMLTDRGTQVYSAPELRFGRLWNERVDIWACGLTLFFMLRNCLPFKGDGSGVAKLLLSGQLPYINWEGMHELVRNAVQQCLTVNMYDRPPAMELLVHPMFSVDLADCSDSRKPPRRYATISFMMRRQISRTAMLGEGEITYASVHLPACGILCCTARWSARSPDGRPRVSTSCTSTSTGYSQDLLFSSASSSGTGGGSEESHPEATQRASTCVKGSEMLRQLAFTKCERALERNAAAETNQDPDSPRVHRSRVQSGTIRRFWTAGNNLQCS